MTPDEYELMCEQMDDIAAQIQDEYQKTGRNHREIAQCLRDEGYVECSDERFEELIKMAEELTR
jgi:hypothetical protein